MSWPGADASPPPSARTIVVTGASRGVGRRVVGHLAAAGHRVVAACRRPADAADLGTGAIPNRTVSVLALDLDDAASIAAFGSALAAEVDHVDVLVNNAGIKAVPGHAWEASAGPLARLDLAAVEAVLRTNVVGPLGVTRAVLPLLRAGSVVANISSQLGSLERSVGVDYAYNASKAALNMVTSTMARDLGPAGIVAVAVNPGWIRTEMGGAEAPLDPDVATADLAALLPRLDPTFAGRFVDRLGAPMPW